MTEQEFLSGYRSWYQAHMILSSYIAIEDRGKGRSALYFLSMSGMYHLLWGALLFVVCEHLAKSHDVPTDLRAAIRTIFKPLKHYRNAVFHTPRVLAPKAIVAFISHDEYVNRAVDLHDQIRDFFRSHKFAGLLPPESIEDFEFFGDILQIKRSSESPPSKN